MVKQNFFYFLLTLLLIIGGHACAEGQDNPIVPDEEEEVSTVIHGICRQNLQWLNSAKVVETANNIANSNISVVRINGVKSGGSIEQVIHSINTFSQKGIKILLVLPKWDEMFPEGYQRIQGPSHLVYKMSDIDLSHFSVFINEFLAQIALYTSKDALIGLELFNEANWGGFNGDLQPTPEGKGVVFKLDTPLDEPSFQNVYIGINKYGKCLKIMREAMDRHLADRDIKLVTHGMVNGAEWENYRWSINRGYTLVLPNMFLTLLQGKHPDQTDKTNYLRYADGIGIHAYPPLVDDMENHLRTYYFNQMNAVLDMSMPYWMTEWGFARPQFQNKGGEELRLDYMRNFIQAIEAIGGTAMTALYEFDATNDHNIWENGKLLESGNIF